MAPKVLGSIYGVELGKPNAFPVMGRNSVRKEDEEWQKYRDRRRELIKKWKSNMKYMS